MSTAHIVTAVTACAPGFCIRAAAIDETGVVTFESAPVVGLADTLEVDMDAGDTEREVVAAYLDPLDGVVRPFADFVVEGWRAARVLAPGDAEDARDEELAAQLLEESRARGIVERWAEGS
ncbi:hypothetical protein B277_11245 [Janibacter hoylei PVAS-1]|uniref:Uncharacterized protein n=1 Tax=Janibacter hoylei PVAS-1 TaxID=1210046 RepID=K1DW94_9MICO|nr:hypothetical protein [Janibacter hoylei]EKA60750.1 hypothetical protein B277_11245 [Janibacter hoylei PVAS-1]RWU85462.1 hypothetical protein CWN80_00235 [Janibacter hoylei PVAS-1]